MVVGWLGLRAQVGLRLYTHDQTVGGLNLYSTTSDVVSDDSVAMAEVFASYVTAALQRAQTEDSMTTAMISRQVIGQATGIVMERFGLGDAEAFAYLRRTSSDTNVKLREIARRLAEGEIALPPPH